MEKFLLLIGDCLIIVVAASLLGGCGLTDVQKTGIATFGQAAVTLGTVSKAAVQDSREKIVQMKRLRLAIEKKKLLPGTPNAGRDFYAKELDLDSGFDLDNMKKRLDVIELMVDYGNLLVTFSGDGQEKELKTAAAKFTDSVKNFPDNPLTKDQINGLGQVVIVLGNLWIEQEKKEALKKIIPGVSPLLKKICGSLEHDFDLKKRGVAMNVYQAQDRLAREALEGLKGDGGSMGDRLLLIDGFMLADETGKTLEADAKRLLRTVAAMRKADEKLGALISKDQITTEEIEEFADNAHDLATALRPFLH